MDICRPRSTGQGDAADGDVLRVRNLTRESLLSSLFHLLKSDATALGADPFAFFVKGALHIFHGRFTAGALHDIKWQKHRASALQLLQILIRSDVKTPSGETPSAR